MPESDFSHLEQFIGSASGRMVFEPFDKLSADAVVTRATVSMSGKGFSGPVKDFAGLTVRLAGVKVENNGWVPEDDSTKNWIIDFGCMVSLSSMEMSNDGGNTRLDELIELFITSMESVLDKSGMNSTLFSMITREGKSPYTLKEFISACIESAFGKTLTIRERGLVGAIAEQVCKLIEDRYSGKQSHYGKMYDKYGSAPSGKQDLDALAKSITLEMQKTLEKNRGLLAVTQSHVYKIHATSENGFDLTPFYTRSGGKSVARFPEMQVSKILVVFNTNVDEDTVKSNLKVSVENLPTAVRVATGDRPPFYVSNGTVSSTVSLPDFSDEINALISDLKAKNIDGPYPVYLDVVQGTASVISIAEPVLELSLQGDCTRDGSTGFQLDIPTQSQTPFDLVFPVIQSGNGGAGSSLAVSTITLTYSSECEPWFAIPMTVPSAAGSYRAVSVKPGDVLSQEVKPGPAREIFGAGLLLRGLEKTNELFLEIYKSKAGKPDGAVLGSVPFSVEQKDEPHWINVLLSDNITLPTSFSDEDTLCLVVRLGSGAVEWGFETFAQTMPGLMLDPGTGMFQPLTIGGSKPVGGHRLLIALTEDSGIMTFHMGGQSLSMNPEEKNGQISLSPASPIIITANASSEYMATASLTCHTQATVTFKRIRFSYSLT